MGRLTLCKAQHAASEAQPDLRTGQKDQWPKEGPREKSGFRHVLHLPLGLALTLFESHSRIGSGLEVSFFTQERAALLLGNFLEEFWGCPLSMYRLSFNV